MCLFFLNNKKEESMESKAILLNLFLPRTRGACISHFRNLLELTQIDISNELGINRTSISKMENGDINVSENVWSYVLTLIHQETHFANSISYIEFKQMIERLIKSELDGKGGLEWKEQRLS
jgi:transcriptional regulator with XRE-family HTH domain